MRRISFFIFLLALVAICNGAMAATIPAGTVANYALVDGTSYTLEGNVTATATAFLPGNNINFDGMGHTITYATSTAGYAFSATGKSGINIYNVTVVSTNAGVSNAYAMYFYNCDDVDIDDVSSYSEKSYGMYLRNTQHADITGSTIRSNTGTAFYLNGASNNTIRGNIIKSTSTYALFGENTYNNRYEGNDIDSTTGTAVYLPATSRSSIFINNDIDSGAASAAAFRIVDGHGHNITGNTIDSVNNIALYLSVSSGGCYQNTIRDNTLTAANSNQALYVYDGYQNTVVNNTCISSSSNGAYFRGSESNTITDNTFISSTNDGLFIGYGANNNIVRRNTCDSGNRMGIFIFNVTGNTFEDNIVTGTYCSAPHTGNHTLAMGDSITEGGQGGTTYGELYSLFEDLMSADYPWYVSNQGFSGERAWQGRERFVQELDIFEPTEVNIMYGTNDLLDSRPQQDIIDDILWMAEQADNRGIVPHILLTPSIYTGNQARIYLDQNLSTQAIAAGYDVINVYDAIDATPGNGIYDAHVAENFEDGIHPNTVGNGLIASALYADWLADGAHIEATNADPIAANFETLELDPVTIRITLNASAWKVVWKVNGNVVETDGSGTTASMTYIPSTVGTYVITAEIYRGDTVETITWTAYATNNAQQRTADGILNNIFASFGLIAMIPMILIAIAIMGLFYGTQTGVVGDVTEIIKIAVMLMIAVLIIGAMATMV